MADPSGTRRQRNSICKLPNQELTVPLSLLTELQLMQALTLQTPQGIQNSVVSY